MANSSPLPDPGDIRIAVIGLGYVGLPLAVEFGKERPTLGFDIDAQRISELTDRNDITGEVAGQEIDAAKNLSFSSDPDCIADCNVYIVTVPTPIDRNRQPDLSRSKQRRNWLVRSSKPEIS